ncbi:MAG: GWxTD domain-containing protein [Patescibacteria group bacterium]
MRKISPLIMFFLFLTSGCTKKATLKYAGLEAIQACEENFYKKYHMFISKEEENEFKEIKTPTECQNFLNKFWSKRDSDPATEENEFKTLLQQRALDIEQEILSNNPGSAGFSFKNNRGFDGDPARVYMLHGLPHYMETVENNPKHVDLMLWLYLDERSKHKFRFLFYHRNDHPTYVLFRPVFYITQALEEINKNPTFTHPDDVYNELSQTGKYLFILSLVEFSDDPSLNVDKALAAPRSAAEIAKNSAPKTIGELPKKEGIVLSNRRNALIPAEFNYEILDNQLTLKITVESKNLDWTLKNEIMESEWFVKIIAWSGEKKHTEEKIIDLKSTKETIEKENPVFVFNSEPVELYKESIRISVYIKNNNKYNAWIEKIK